MRSVSPTCFLHATQPVKIAGFAMTGNPMAPANASGPKSVKLFVNALNMDFAAATNGTPAQEVELPASGQHVDLKVAKFNNVHTLTVMVSSNQKDSEFTRCVFVSACCVYVCECVCVCVCGRGGEGRVVLLFCCFVVSEFE
jgi:hypothetical protein